MQSAEQKQDYTFSRPGPCCYLFRMSETDVHPADFRLVLCTCPDQTVARDLARQLVEQRLAACVNLVPGLTSVYHWQGKLEQGTEVLLLIKTTAARYAALEKAIQARHPYELPEIIAVTLTDGLPAYLKWITTSLEPTP
jgi:periplasmic divalent cation tolerance protein